MIEGVMKTYQKSSIPFPTHLITCEMIRNYLSELDLEEQKSKEEEGKNE
jgi:hypothetical protein